MGKWSEEGGDGLEFTTLTSVFCGSYKQACLGSPYTTNVKLLLRIA